LVLNNDTHKTFRLAVPLLQAGCGGGALVLALLAHCPVWAVAGLGLLLAGAMWPALMPPARRPQAWRRGLRLAWVCTAVLAGGVLLAAGRESFWDAYYAVLIWFVAAVIGLACREARQAPPGFHGELLLALWAVGGVVIWIGAAWLNNESSAFYPGMLFLLAWLILVRIRFPMPVSLKLGLHTLILFIVALPLVDLFIPGTPVHSGAMAPVPDKIYTPSNAKKDPAEFAQWWGRYLEQWDLMARDVFMADPDGVLPFRLRPNSQGFLFRSRISINSRGMRGPEIPADKGAAYRIVALGESTTFGCTLNPGDRPWPELLEQIIRERLHPARPIEVINAGVPAYTLSQNVNRLAREILPLKPDMILSYHGYNGFKLFTKSLPRSQGQRPAPIYKPRPLRLLAQVEYRLKMDVYKARTAMKTPPLLANPLETEYARAYQQLIQIARTNHIRLALANFSMAVNPGSSPETVKFYQAGFPLVQWEVRANRVHSLIVKQMVQAHPEVGFIDTHTNLDGCSENYIDLVHFTQAGRQQLAETIFVGIQKTLEADLATGSPVKDP
jgi:lysophospholipase L1-like esterase